MESPGYTDTFFDCQGTLDSYEDTFPSTDDNFVMLQWELSLADTGIKHSHQTLQPSVSHPNKMQQLGANTGLILFVYYVLTLLLRPLARHSFIMRSLKRLYFVRERSPSDSIFEPSKNK